MWSIASHKEGLCSQSCLFSAARRQTPTAPDTGVHRLRFFALNDLPWCSSLADRQEEVSSSTGKSLATRRQQATQKDGPFRSKGYCWLAKSMRSIIRLVSPKRAKRGFMRRYKVLLILLLGWMVLGLAVLQGSSDAVPPSEFPRTFSGKRLTTRVALWKKTRPSNRPTMGVAFWRKKGKRVIMVRDVHLSEWAPAWPPPVRETPPSLGRYAREHSLTARRSGGPSRSGLRAVLQRLYTGLRPLRHHRPRLRLKKAAITDDDLRDIRTSATTMTGREASRLDAGAQWTGSLPTSGGGTTGLPGMARVSPPAASGFNSPGP